MSTEAACSTSNKRKFSVPVAGDKTMSAANNKIVVVKSDTSDITKSKKETAIVSNRVKVKRKTIVERSLSDSQYEELFSAVAARVLSGEVFTESNDNLFKEGNENNGDEKTKQVDYAEVFSSTVSDKSLNNSKHYNEVTPHTSPLEENEGRSLLKQPGIPKKKQKQSKLITTKRTCLGYGQKCTEDDGRLSTASENTKGNFVEKGTWVQCVSCSKWRYLASCSDPSSLAEQWTCSMNDGSCSNPEESWDKELSQDCFIYTQFRPGSLVWAKIAGYPPWPAMVDTDPDCNTFCDCSDDGEVHRYHVVFLDDQVSRAWVNHRFVDPYQSDETPVKSDRSHKHREYEKDLETAKSRAQEALKMSMEDRIAKYRFETRYHGKNHWSSNKSVGEKKHKKKEKVENQKVKNLNKRRKEIDLQQEKNNIGESNSKIKDNTKDPEKESFPHFNSDTFTMEIEKEEQYHEIIHPKVKNKKASTRQQEPATRVQRQDNSESTLPSPIEKDDYWSVSVSQSSEVLFEDLGMIGEMDDEPTVCEETSWEEFEQLVME